jgi:hypothetical protein
MSLTSEEKTRRQDELDELDDGTENSREWAEGKRIGSKF